VNAKGFGDFADGFAPTCTVADDLTHALGDPAKPAGGRTGYRATGLPGPGTARAGAVQMQLVRPEVKEIAVHAAHVSAKNGAFSRIAPRTGPTAPPSLAAGANLDSRLRGRRLS
jgi:hypothetical protein